MMHDNSLKQELATSLQRWHLKLLCLCNYRYGNFAERVLETIHSRLSAKFPYL